MRDLSRQGFDYICLENVFLKILFQIHTTKGEVTKLSYKLDMLIG